MFIEAASMVKCLPPDLSIEDDFNMGASPGGMTSLAPTVRKRNKETVSCFSKKEGHENGLPTKFERSLT